MNNMQINNTISQLKGTTPSRCLSWPPHLFWLANYVKDNKSNKMVECGVARGGTLALCHKVRPEMQIIGMDSWDVVRGATDPGGVTSVDDQQKCNKWIGSRWGTMGEVYETYNMIQSSYENLTLIKGYFNDTMSKNMHLLNDIDILRLDCDYYDPITMCFELLYDNVKKGGVIILDDWHFNPSGVQGALEDFLEKRNINVIIHTHAPNKCCHNVSFSKKAKYRCNRGSGPAYFIKP